MPHFKEDTKANEEVKEIMRTPRDKIIIRKIHATIHILQQKIHDMGDELNELQKLLISLEYERNKK